MFISFFSHTDYTTGIDYQSHPDCIHQEDLNFDPNTQIANLQRTKKGEYSIQIQDKPEPPETAETKKSRIFQSLVSLTSLDATTDQSILEWVTFSDKEKWDLIVERVFGGNPHAQSAMFAKMLAWNKKPLFLQYVQKCQQDTDNILAFFSMASIEEGE